MCESGGGEGQFEDSGAMKEDACADMDVLTRPFSMYVSRIQSGWTCEEPNIRCTQIRNRAVGQGIYIRASFTGGLGPNIFTNPETKNLLVEYGGKEAGSKNKLC